MPAQSPFTQPFPAFYFNDSIKTYTTQESSRLYWVPTEEESGRNYQFPALLDSDVLAYYGHPSSELMGILGRYTKEEIGQQLSDLAKEYRAQSGGRKVITAFYIIYGTVWPGGDIGIINESLLQEYIDYAAEHDMLVFIDHQIGKYTPAQALRRMLPYLKYPHVHLALDPEWRTTKPMQEIGSVTGAEINQVQSIMEDYILENDLPGDRMLVIHQFRYSMIQNREEIVSGLNHVRLVLCADGFGSPSVKRNSYAYNALAGNIPIKGFKLFYRSGFAGAGYDQPLLTPAEVYALNPRPYLIMYQ
ncbi:hypothetical protein FACS1894172_00590 [Spirochaetia bacterium]|nr:hypothetical protein FACS1894164_07380 [Spirochaetia bacterium]GHU29445.1 hypothetical protein FACS1894172_00590 [Spirochaetia bacterium]